MKFPNTLPVLLVLIPLACGGGGSSPGGDSTSTNIQPPTILVQPQDITVDIPQPATFTVTAQGGGLTYQWRKDGTDISGAVNASYTTPPSNLQMQGATYQVVVRNSAGNITSSSAQLTVRNTAFINGPNLGSPRGGHTATLLRDGTILIAGGFSDSNLTPLSTALQFNPATQSITQTGSLHVARSHHSATLLQDGRVLIAGGRMGSQGSLATAELYDPIQGTFTPVSPMISARALHTATLLSSGKVLLAGGRIFTPGAGVGFNSLDSLELFDPTNNTFASAGKLITARDLHTATLLPDGSVLLAGGTRNLWDVDTVERYQPSNGTVSPAGVLRYARLAAAAAPLPDGKVLFFGGIHHFNNTLVVYVTPPEIWDPATQHGADLPQFLVHGAKAIPVPIDSQRILFVGGVDTAGFATSSTTIYDISRQQFSPGPTLTSFRIDHAIVRTSTGQIWVFGGGSANGWGDPLASSEFM